MRKLVELTGDQGTSNYYCHESSKCSIVPIEITPLIKLMNEDKENILPKIWKMIAARVLILSNSDFMEDNFKGLSQTAITYFCNLCEIKVYNDDSVDMTTGGIIFSGSGFAPEGSDS